MQVRRITGVSYSSERAISLSLFADQAALYPILNSQPLYILSSSVNDVEKEEISEYMEEAGYTDGQYGELLNKLKIEGIEAEAQAGFTVPIEYTVTNDGYCYSVCQTRNANAILVCFSYHTSIS